MTLPTPNLIRATRVADRLCVHIFAQGGGDEGHFIYLSLEAGAAFGQDVALILNDIRRDKYAAQNEAAKTQP